MSRQRLWLRDAVRTAHPNSPWLRDRPIRADHHINVSIILYMDTILPLAEVRSRLSPLVGSVELTHERVVITKNGKPAAVLISYEDLESLEETLEILADPDALAEIKTSLADESRFTLAEIKRDLTNRPADSSPGTSDTANGAHPGARSGSAE